MAVETAYYDDGMTCWDEGEIQGFELPDPPVDDVSHSTSPVEESYQESNYTELVATNDAALSSPRWIVPLLVSYTPKNATGPLLIAGCAGKQTVDTSSTDSPDNSNDSSIEGDTSSVGCEDSAFEQIQDAVDFAADGDTVEVCDGVYDSFSVFDKSLTIRARAGHSPQIDGSYETTSRGNVQFAGADGQHEFVLEGFEISGHYYTGVYISDDSGTIRLANLNIHDNGTSSDDYQGFGLYVITSGTDSATISFRDSVVYNQPSSGIYFYLSSSNDDLEMNNIESYNNISSGIDIAGTIDDSDGNPAVTAYGLNLHDNGNPETHGGGLWLQSVTVSIDSSTITGNTALRGGGIFSGYSSFLTLNDCEVQDNVATGTNGTSGGLQLYSSGITTAYNTNWGGTNEPYDVSTQYPEQTAQPDRLYDFGTNASFQCEFEVGCWDL